MSVLIHSNPAQPKIWGDNSEERRANFSASVERNRAALNALCPPPLPEAAKVKTPIPEIREQYKAQLKANLELQKQLINQKAYVVYWLSNAKGLFEISENASIGGIYATCMADPYSAAGHIAEIGSCNKNFKAFALLKEQEEDLRKKLSSSTLKPSPASAAANPEASAKMKAEQTAPAIIIQPPNSAASRQESLAKLNHALDAIAPSSNSASAATTASTIIIQPSNSATVPSVSSGNPLEENLRQQGELEYQLKVVGMGYGAIIWSASGTIKSLYERGLNANGEFVCKIYNDENNSLQTYIRLKSEEKKLRANAESSAKMKIGNPAFDKVNGAMYEKPIVDENHFPLLTPEQVKAQKLKLWNDELTVNRNEQAQLKDKKLDLFFSAPIDIECNTQYSDTYTSLFNYAKDKRINYRWILRDGFYVGSDRFVVYLDSNVSIADAYYFAKDKDSVIEDIGDKNLNRYAQLKKRELEILTWAPSLSTK